MTRGKLWLTTLLACLALSAPRAALEGGGLRVGAARALAQSAPADAAVPARVFLIVGSADGEGTAPALAKMDALKRAPFDAFPKKDLLQQVDVTLAVGADREVELPNGRKLRITLLEKTKDGRYRVNVSINRPSKQDYLPVLTVVAAPGDPFFVAGQKLGNGTLIIGVSVGKIG